MGQCVSSSTHSSSACSNYGDYKKLKSKEDSPVLKKNKSQKEDSYYLKYIKSYPGLHFPFNPRKQIKQSFPLINNTDNYMAFQVIATNPHMYCVRPFIGVVLPRSTRDITVTMEAQKETAPNMQCKDRFLLQTVFARPGATIKDITLEMFEKNSGYEVKELLIPVVYLAPPKSQYLSSDKNTPIIIEARNSIDEQIKKLQQEVNYLRRHINNNQRSTDEDYVIM